MRNWIDIINEGDDFMDGRNREKHIEQLIHYAFNKIGLTINYNNYSVSYDETTRQAEVALEDSNVTLDALNRLRETGLSDDFEIQNGSDALRVCFSVSPAMDGAQLPN